MSIASEEDEEPEAGCSPSETAALIAVAIDGDDRAFDELYRVHRPRIYGRMVALLRNPDDAEDVAQHAFMVLWESLPTLHDGGRKMASWLDSVAHNHAVDHIRHHGRVQLVDPLDVEHLRSDESDRAADRLAAQLDGELFLFVERLSERERQVVFLRFVADLSSEETAQALGCSPGTVRQTQHRALLALKENLGERPNADTRCQRVAMRRLRPPSPRQRPPAFYGPAWALGRAA